MEHFNTKQFFITIIAVAAIAYLIFYHKPEIAPVRTDIPTSEPTATTAWPSAEVRQQKISENTVVYTITAIYPVAESEAVTMYFKHFVDDQIASFKNDVGGVPATEGQQVSLDISYRHQQATRADAYVFTIATDTGGAHGLQATKTFSFSASGSPITLDSLFTNTDTALKSISVYVQAELMKREFADVDWIKEGAAPTKDNYQQFVVTDDGITFLFDPYQVAPYAAGLQTVNVPKAIFAKQANSAYFSQ